jgi:plastocyanin
MLFKAVAVAALVAALPQLADAAEVVVKQQDKKFDPGAVSAAVGDTIVFTNEDKVAHNVMVASGPNKFNLGSVKPGAKAQTTLQAAGEVEVRCAIHPKMKLTLTVTE